MAEYEPDKSYLLSENIYEKDIILTAYESKKIEIYNMSPKVTGFAVSIDDPSIHSKINILELTGYVFHGKNSRVHNYLEGEINILIFLKETPTNSISLIISSYVSDEINFSLTITSLYAEIKDLDQSRIKLISIVGEDYDCCGDDRDLDYYGAGARVEINLFNPMNTSIELNISSRYNFDIIEIQANSNKFTNFTLPELSYFVIYYNNDRQNWLSEIFLSNLGSSIINVTYSMVGEEKGTINPNYIDPGFSGHTNFDNNHLIIGLALIFLIIISIICIIKKLYSD